VGAGDLGRNLAARGRGDGGEGADDFSQRREAAVAGENAEEVLRQRREAKHAGDRVDRLGGRIAADLGVADEGGKIFGGRERFAQLLEIGFNRRDQVLLASQIEERRCVAPLQAGRDAAGILHARQILLKRVPPAKRWAAGLSDSE